MSESKYYYWKIVQGYYCGSWEDLTQSESMIEARSSLRDYRENDPAPIRLIERRELREPIELDTYRIVRFRFRKGRKIIKRGISLSEARSHCNDPDTSGDQWFDGYERESGARDALNKAAELGS